MRTAFVEALSEAAAADSRVTLVTGDLGFGVVQDFARRFPRQFINAGVAEQNMTGIAAGAAMSGRIVFTYSIANFSTLRPLEQIRNDICYHGANVVVVSVGGGMAYGALGASHHATEDLAMLRSLPEMTVVAPGDPAETTAAVRHVARGIGPCYLRLGRAGEPAVHSTEIAWHLGRAIRVRDGGDATIVSTGGMLATAVAVSDRLAAESGIRLRVLSMHTIKPLDDEALLAAARETRAIFTLEEHSIIGGLGGAVAETVLERCETHVRFRRFGLESGFVREVGGQEHLLRRLGLDPDSIGSRILADLGGSRLHSAA